MNRRSMMTGAVAMALVSAVAAAVQPIAPAAASPSSQAAEWLAILSRLTPAQIALYTKHLRSADPRFHEIADAVDRWSAARQEFRAINED